MFSDISQLHRFLQLKCVKDWVGWAEAEAVLLKQYKNTVKVLVIEDCIKNFTFLCQDDVLVDNDPRDTSRCKELLEQGYIIGKASGYRCNCLADSLLQLLLHEGVLQGPENMSALEKWRHELCQKVRKHLNDNVNEAFRPRERNDSQFVFDGAGDLHALASFQHHRHSESIIKCFLTNVDCRRSFRVILF